MNVGIQNELIHNQGKTLSVLSIEKPYCGLMRTRQVSRHCSSHICVGLFSHCVVYVTSVAAMSNICILYFRINYHPETSLWCGDSLAEARCWMSKQAPLSTTFFFCPSSNSALPCLGRVNAVVGGVCNYVGAHFSSPWPSQIVSRVRANANTETRVGDACFSLYLYGPFFFLVFPV